MDPNSSFFELQRKIAGKKSLEAKRDELQKQKRVYEREALSLRAALRREQEDVAKLEGRSLANYFYQVIGKLDDKLDQARKEAYAAKVKLDTSDRELAEIDGELQQILNELAQIRVAQVQYQEMLENKRAALRASGGEAAEEILALEQRIAALETEKREIREAINAGASARGIAERIESELRDADNWNTWDIIGGGGIITHLEKHGHLDEAQELVSQLQSNLRRFKTELADIRIDADLQVNIDGFLRFADYFFDSLFADWAVGDRISESMDSVARTKSQINRMLKQLNQMEAVSDHELQGLKQQLEQWIVNA